jgi:hypothetical protein
MHLERGAVENLAVTFELIDPLQLNSSTLRISSKYVKSYYYSN